MEKWEFLVKISQIQKNFEFGVFTENWSNISIDHFQVIREPI